METGLASSSTESNPESMTNCQPSVVGCENEGAARASSSSDWFTLDLLANEEEVSKSMLSLSASSKHVVRGPGTTFSSAADDFSPRRTSTSSQDDDELDRKLFHSPSNDIPAEFSEDEPVAPLETSKTHEENREAIIRDLESARKQVDKTSQQFIERIRGAAWRRKKEVTRSRDSLIAKEKRQLEANAAKQKAAEEAAKAALLQPCQPSSNGTSTSRALTRNQQFKARPLPASTGIKGVGGQSGVPKVAVRPTTTPFSPLLGNRRRKNIRVQSLIKSSLHSARNKENHSGEINAQKYGRSGALKWVKGFKARPVPRSVGAVGHGGQTGVPKVKKRTTTIPYSPKLGRKRDATSRAKVVNAPREGSTVLSGKIIESDASTPASAPLHGLDFLITPEERSARAGTQSTGMAFVPRSTQRAEERARFDKHQAERAVRRSAEVKIKRRNEMKHLQKELRRLSLNL